ncbi:MAG: phytanoyl-CoA dioxygenase family protein [Armatimonadetes bacterium]|nr:phytanoyl-CoA dioxygenase family protein [Armatimonadota bacterium]
MNYSPSTLNVADIELFAENLDVKRAGEIYQEHGCLVVRGLMKPYIEAITRDIEETAQQSIALLDSAKRIPEGWTTPDGTLFIPAPGNYNRDKQIMVLGVGYFTSAAFFQSAFDKTTLDIVESILGSNIELFLNGQCLYKEPVGGHPKKLHQDAAYFEHRYQGPVATLNYCVWTWDRAVPIVGQAGDSIFFAVHTIHGSQENHSEKARPVFIHRYRSADDYVVIGASTVEKRTEAEKHIAEAKKENQRGLMVRGFRPFTVEANDKL